MQAGHESHPRGRSPFVAAFLSLLFPGLGHAYVGAYRRGLGFAAPPLLIGALAAGFAVRMTVFDLAGLALQSWFLIFVFVANLVALVYRAFAIVDAWAIARMLEAAPRRRGSAPRSAAVGPLGGLAAVLLVMSGIHVAVARYDLLVAGTAGCIFDETADCGQAPEPSGSGDLPDASDEPVATGPEASLGPTVTGQPIPPWDGQERLNILLVGADTQGGGFNTDTLITVSIDPQTNQVVMFQLPRDMVDVPVPAGPARTLYGSVYQGKINSLFVNARNRSDVWPGDTRLERGMNGLKAVLGNLYGLDIRYFVQVDFQGFRDVVNALGGVTINVQVPVLDDNFPQPGQHRLRLYIPAGMQHMTGGEALNYARSRKSTSDFERAARQQRVLVSLRQQLDIGAAFRNIEPLAQAIGSAARTDIPRDLVPQLLGLAQRIDTRSIRSFTFTPPFYGKESVELPGRGYIIQPNVSRIRTAVAEAFDIDPDFAEQRDALADEAAVVWVLNGSGRNGEAARLSEYLSYLGIAASAPRQTPDINGLQATTIRVYNGAGDAFPLTLAKLLDVFGVAATEVTDPAVQANFVVITGVTTPQLTPPPLP